MKDTQKSHGMCTLCYYICDREQETVCTSCPFLGGKGNFLPVLKTVSDQRIRNIVQDILDSIDVEGEYVVYGMGSESTSLADIQCRLYRWLWTAAEGLCRKLPFVASDGEIVSVWEEVQQNFPAPLEFMRLASASEHPTSVMAVNAFMDSFLFIVKALAASQSLSIDTVTFKEDEVEDERLVGKIYMLHVTSAPR